MSNDDRFEWGPDDHIGRMIRKIPYDKPSPDLVHRIMAPRKPIQPHIARRVLSWLIKPVHIRLSPALVMGIVCIFMLPAMYFITSKPTGPVVAEKSMNTASKVPVVFYYDEQGVRSVSLMGSFNNWNPTKHELKWNPDIQQWTLQLYLMPGKYDYVFLVNGERVSADPSADLIHRDDFGNRNSVLFVGGKNDSQI